MPEGEAAGAQAGQGQQAPGDSQQGREEEGGRLAAEGQREVPSCSQGRARSRALHGH